MQTTKTVKTRDSATTILRKLGVNSRDYNLFIDKTDAGLIVNVRAATDHVAQVEAQKVSAQPARAEKPVKVKKEKPAEPEGKLNLPGRKINEKPGEKESVSGYCRRMIKLGYTNNEIFMAMQEHFDAPASKRYYPSWYRWELRKNEEAAKAGK